jgi:hypothetical protein
MVNRRDFLVTGFAAASALSIGNAADVPAQPAAQTGFGSAPRLRLYKVIYDERFADGAAFGTEATRIGLASHAIAGDVTAVWYHDLYPRWQREAVAIAGLTAHGPIFCLERLAWDFGMRVVFRAEHRTPRPGSVEHVLSGPPTMLQWAPALVGAGAAWASRMASLVYSCPERPVLAAMQTATVRSFEGVVQRPEPLVSWIVAPVQRA